MSNLEISPNGPRVAEIKIGVKILFDELVAYDNDGFFVPINHPDAVSFAGVAQQQLGVDDYDNTNGQFTNGQYANVPLIIGAYGITGIKLDSLTQPLDLKAENRGQIIYASDSRTFHLTPKKGRLPIGTYWGVGKMTKDGAGVPDETTDRDIIFLWIDMSRVIPNYYS